MWKEIDTVLYYIPKEFQFFQTTAIFSFIETIVHNCTAGKIKKSPDNIIKFMFPNVKEKLEEIYSKNGSIILYQSATDKTAEKYKHIFDEFKKLMNIPIAIFISSQKNKYSKPYTGIWNIINLAYKKYKKTLNVKTSMYIGNLAGRLNYQHKKLDYSCADRAFAHNIGLKFSTPERIFCENNKFELWEWDPDIINIKDRELALNAKPNIPIPKIKDKIKLLPKSDNYTIIITGLQSCGKSTYAKKIKRMMDADDICMEIISENKNTLENMIKLIESNLSKSKSVIIDMEINNSNILQIIKKSMELTTPILIVEIKIKLSFLKLLDRIKVQTSKSHTVNNIANYQWKSIFKNIQLDIIYKDVPCVLYTESPLVLNNTNELWLQYIY